MLYDLAIIYDSESLKNRLQSPLLRRLRVKYAGRLAATYLPPRTSRRGILSRTLLSIEPANSCSNIVQDSVEFQMPEEVEALLGSLMESLSDSVGTHKLLSYSKT